MNLFGMLSKGERVIVALDEANNQVITWNRSNTFQCWDILPNGEFTEVDIKVYEGSKTLDFNAAETIAKNWLSQDTYFEEVTYVRERVFGGPIGSWSTKPSFLRPKKSC